MSVFLQLIPVIMTNFFTMVASPIFWVVVAIVGFQYRRMARLKKELFDVQEESIIKPTLMATLFGIAGGLVGSFLLVFVGISILEVGIGWLWGVAFVLMLINQRYLCFAYAGGVLSIIKLLFGVPEGLSVPQLMGLVAILHLVESLLILFSGHLGAVPAYIRTKSGEMVGAFNLQKFWPLPIVALAGILIPDTSQLELIKLPDWWPLIPSEVFGDNDNLIYAAVPVVAGLGYGDLAMTALPQKKTWKSSLQLLTYSIILLTLAVIAANWKYLEILPALFGPLGHEFLILYGQKQELNGKPKFISSQEGLMVLDIIIGSPLHNIGVKPGDLILSIDGKSVKDTVDLNQALVNVEWGFEIEFLSGENKVFKRKILQKKEGEALGLIPVPDIYSVSYLDIKTGDGLLRRWLRKLFKRAS